MTLVEKMQRELEREVCRRYRLAVSESPGDSWHRHATVVAFGTGMSPEGVKKILERNGIRNPRTQKGGVA